MDPPPLRRLDLARAAARQATRCSQGPSESRTQSVSPLRTQDEERRLEGVVGVVLVREHAAAGAEHHRPVPLDQAANASSAASPRSGREPLQQLPVSQGGGRPPR